MKLHPAAKKALILLTAQVRLDSKRARLRGNALLSCSP
jgi:hypothetical protein